MFEISKGPTHTSQKKYVPLINGPQSVREIASLVALSHSLLFSPSLPVLTPLSVRYEKEREHACDVQLSHQTQHSTDPHYITSTKGRKKQGRKGKEQVSREEWKNGRMEEWKNGEKLKVKLAWSLVLQHKLFFFIIIYYSFLSLTFCDEHLFQGKGLLLLQ